MTFHDRLRVGKPFSKKLVGKLKHPKKYYCLFTIFFFSWKRIIRFAACPYTLPCLTHLPCTIYLDRQLVARVKCIGNMAGYITLCHESWVFYRIIIFHTYPETCVDFGLPNMIISPSSLSIFIFYILFIRW